MSGTTRLVTLLGLVAFAADILILYVRGVDDWSAGLAIVFYVLLGAAFFLPIFGGLLALANRSMSRMQRRLCVAAGIAVPTFILIAAIEVAHAVSQMN